MRFRPRYSLLTLLVFTALVAGSVKLWYGPHHVVEVNSANTIEDEYTFTRDWLGNKALHGPRVLRKYNYHDGHLFSVEVKYYLNGFRTEHEQEIFVFSGQRPPWTDAESYRPKPPPLPEADRANFQGAIAQEVAKIKALGYQVSLMKYDELE